MLQDNSSNYESISEKEAKEKIRNLVNSMLSFGLLDSLEISVRKNKVTEITIGQRSETYLIPFADSLNALEIAETLGGSLVNPVSQNKNPRFFGLKYDSVIPEMKRNTGFISSLFKFKR